MMQRSQLYINGKWVSPNGEGTIDVINPSTEEVIGSVPISSHADVDLAVAAAKAAFPSWSKSSIEERIHFLNSISAAFKSRGEELAQLIPGSDLVLIDDCGHFPMQEKTEQISQPLLAFLHKNVAAKRLHDGK